MTIIQRPHLALLALPTFLAVLAREAPAQQREYVLKQVAVPHHYYWREMYVPQVTSGPSAATWSPDGTELIYSMQGSLWRQKLGTTEAVQLTAGDGYDHQPDWSRSGRWVLYPSTRNDAVELWLLDLRSGATRALLADGNVHVDPKWSPDGRRVAWVSTAFEGRWHVFVAPFDTATGTLGRAERITADRNSKLPRYYYSAWDHYLSPTWSPDGRELILVSNRGRIWGTGGFWRMEARAGAPMREVWYEETTWKARPEWAPNGKRVIYSGYHGRQWNQLWLMTADGGDPFQLTYGDFDATAPRWSPDGSRVAYISNEAGNTSLWVVEIPGGRRTRIEAPPRTRRYATPVGRLTIMVQDSTRGFVSARVSVFDSTGKSWTPDDAWRHGDEAFVRGERGFEYGYFHSDGRSTLTLPAGRYTVEAWKGPEHTVGRAEVTARADSTVSTVITLGRVFDLPRNGWWGGDLHVHMNYGGHYRNTPGNLKRQAQAEGLHVVENLIVNKEQRIPDIAWWRPGTDPVSDDRFVLAHAEEYHTSFWGHSALLGLKEYFVLPNYAGYVNTGAASLVPTNADVFDIAHAQGGITGYVHPFDSRPDPFDRTQPIRYEMPVDAALGKVDYFEVMGYSDHLVTSEFWYRLLNNGFRIPAAAGTDAFPNYASLRGPPGLVRVYARVGPRLEHRGFLEAIKAGRTFVTNGPLLGLGVRTAGRQDGKTADEWSGIGDEIRLPAGRHMLQVVVTLRSNVPVDHLELVRNGRVAVSVPLRGERTAADTLLTLPVDSSGWYIVRAWSERPRLPVLDLYPFASTSPFYVMVGDQPIRSREEADYFLTWISRVRDEVERHTGWNTPAEREGVLTMLDRASSEFQARRP
ncbi:MAG TPA: CehA/McbA family metallohydrolase [Gemmatimonadales bacterium]